MKTLTKEEIKKKVLTYGDWEWWAERPFGAFILSFWSGGQNREYMGNVGVDVQWPASLFQKGAWYKSEKVWDNFAHQITKNYLNKGGSVYKIVSSCENYGKKSKKEIDRLIKSELSLFEKFERLAGILTQDTSYVWLAHGLEHIYRKKIYVEASKYITAGEIDKFIGDISYPVKKNAYHYLEKSLRGNKPLSEIGKKFAWIKCRDGFSDGFSLAELKKERFLQKKMKRAKFIKPRIPKQLREIAEITQELVYFRTLRTDILYELMWRARPITKAVARFYKIPFKELIDYSVPDLLAGNPKKYPRKVTYISKGRDWTLIDRPILNERYGNLSIIKGLTANHGTATGHAKIVKTAHEIDKVKVGDILFAPTTAPSFIMGMKRAAAFVTDEGGITSHAAIVSREMNKPCIIGTKIGTKIFKDGDLVEVDANKGMVKKI